MAGEFIKIRNGVEAPKGFHYMADGKLMSNANHIEMFGYVERTISGINVNTKDISHLGGTKSITINGDSGAIFSLEIFDDATATNYYNFTTNTFSTSRSGVYNVVLTGSQSYSITFPAVASSLIKYTIELTAITVENIKTNHVELVEVLNADGTFNINKSTGSNSNVLQKILHQDVAKNLFLSTVAPQSTAVYADTVNGAVSSSNRVIVDGVASVVYSGEDAADVFLSPNIAIGDLVTGTGIAASVHALVTKINPDGDNAKEIEMSTTDSIGDGVAITFTPAFRGTTPNADTTTGRHTFVTSSGADAKFNFSITCTALAGRTLKVIRVPTVDDLCSFKNITFASAASAIPGEDTSSANLFYRWPVANAAGLAEGMVLDPSRSDGGANTTTPAKITKYLSTIASTSVKNREYYTDIISTSLEDQYFPGVDVSGQDATAVDRNGVVTAQVGNLIFNVQQADALKSDASVRIYAYGSTQIQAMTGMSVSLSNIAVTPTQISTTTTGAISASTGISVAEVGNISIGSSIRGIGIDSSSAAPTVTKKSVATGAGDVVASAAQTIESGMRLFFDGSSNVVTITGTIAITNMALSDTTLAFDIERFLTCE